MQEKIKEFLGAKTIGSKIIFKEELESTQTEIKKLVEKGIENGTMIVTNYQTKGMGTHDRKWFSEKGKNICFSFVIYPKCKVQGLDGITVDIAKCMIEAIYSVVGKKLDIKKPNDIVYNGKKVGGILTQIVSAGEKVKCLIIGIGINVNQIAFPDEISNIATSLKKEFGKEFSREKIIAEFCNEFEKYCIKREII